MNIYRDKEEERDGCLFSTGMQAEGRVRKRECERKRGSERERESGREGKRERERD